MVAMVAIFTLAVMDVKENRGDKVAPGGTQFLPNKMEDQYVSNIDTTLLPIMNRIRRLNHRCPYNNKRLTRRTENTLNQAEVMQDIIKQRMKVVTDEDKSKQYAKILRELADYIQPEQTIDE